MITNENFESGIYKVTFHKGSLKIKEPLEIYGNMYRETTPGLFGYSLKPISMVNGEQFPEEFINRMPTDGIFTFSYTIFTNDSISFSKLTKEEIKEKVHHFL